MNNDYLPGEQLALLDKPKLSADYIRQIANEVATFHPDCMITSIEHLYLMPIECYHVRYLTPRSQSAVVYTRNEDGRLVAAATWTYDASAHFEDRHQGGAPL